MKVLPMRSQIHQSKFKNFLKLSFQLFFLSVFQNEFFILMKVIAVLKTDARPALKQMNICIQNTGYANWSFTFAIFAAMNQRYLWPKMDERCVTTNLKLQFLFECVCKFMWHTFNTYVECFVILTWHQS
jgi:hypothetical protein